MNKITKVLSAVGVGIVLLGAGAYSGSVLFPQTIEVTKTVEVPVINTVEVVKEVPVEKIVTETVEVPVDNGNLNTVIDWVQDEFDEDITADYIIFEHSSLIDAEAHIRGNFKSILKDNDFFDDGELLGDYRTSEVSIKKISDAEVVSRDFEDKDLELKYIVTLRAQEDSSSDKEYFDIEFTIPFENGQLVDEDIEVETI